MRQKFRERQLLAHPVEQSSILLFMLETHEVLCRVVHENWVVNIVLVRALESLVLAGNRPCGDKRITPGSFVEHVNRVVIFISDLKSVILGFAQLVGRVGVVRRRFQFYLLTYVTV
jgi:hypothetical protein